MNALHAVTQEPVVVMPFIWSKTSGTISDPTAAPVAAPRGNSEGFRGGVGREAWRAFSGRYW